jgi:hypothetical protein
MRQSVRKRKTQRRSIAIPRSRLAGALRKLETALAENPREFGAQARAFLARFHNYSPLNRMLIFLQRRDATFLKGRKQWEMDGRTVRRGARAIYILAPVLKPDEPMPPKRFTQVKVYDVADTDGPPFSPPSSVQLSSGEDLVAERLRDLEEWVRGSGLDLRYEAPEVNTLTDGATNGLTIWVRPDLRPAERLGVLAHEIAHVKLHFRRKQRGQTLLVDEPKQPTSRDLKELEAELTAFLLLQFCGIDCSKSSAAYLNSWSASVSKIREHAERCFVVACSVLRDCEKKHYRRLVEQGAIVIVDEARAALL